MSYFTDNKEDPRVQIQGYYLDDVYEKGKDSEHYPTLEKIASILHPRRIIDPAFRDIFPELVEKPF